MKLLWLLQPPQLMEALLRGVTLILLVVGFWRFQSFRI